MQKATTIINYLNLISALYLIAVTLFHWSHLHIIGYYVFFTTYVIEVLVEKRWKQIKLDKVAIYYMVMLLFFLLPLLYRPFDTATYFKLLLEKRYSLLGLGIVGFFGLNSKYRLSYFLNTFILTSVCTILYLIIFKIGLIDYLTSPDRNMLFNLSRIEHVNSHMMFDFYLNIANIGCWYILSRLWRRAKPLNHIWYVGAMLLILFTGLQSEGRSGYIIYILLTVAFIFFEVWKKSKLSSLFFAMLIPFFIIFMASQHKRFDSEYLQREPRLWLWEAATEVIEENPIVGHGISKAQEKYNIARERHETPDFHKQWCETLRVKYIDCHNQYLQIMMEFGVLGIAFVIFLYGYPFFIVESRRKLLAFFVIALCAWQSIFDMFITGRFCFIFCFLTLLLLRVKNNITTATALATNVPAKEAKNEAGLLT